MMAVFPLSADTGYGGRDGAGHRDRLGSFTVKPVTGPTNFAGM